jgi:hypothetical protein
MATVSISLLPKINSSTNIVEEERFVIDENGNLIKQTILLNQKNSDSSFFDIVKETVPFSIGQATFSTSSSFRPGSLFAFLNGINISPDIRELDDQSFSIDSSYLGIDPLEYELFVSYTKKV